MFTYESTLTKKLTQAIELRDDLTQWAKDIGYDKAPEELVLQTLVEKIDAAHQRFDSRVEQYWELSEKRIQLASGTEHAIKPLVTIMWRDIVCQFRDGTVANDLLKILCQKIQKFTLPPFPINRKKLAFPKEVRLYEDSYTLLGQYFGWLIDLLHSVQFTPNRTPFTLIELKEQALQFNALTQQGMYKADMLREIQLTQNQSYKQLDQAIQAARGRMLIYRRVAKRIAR